LIDGARNQIKKILASDPSIRKEIEGHASEPGGVANGNPASPNRAAALWDDKNFKTALAAIESRLQSIPNR
jgi:hypothetical protein